MSGGILGNGFNPRSASNLMVWCSWYNGVWMRHFRCCWIKSLLMLTLPQKNSIFLLWFGGKGILTYCFWRDSLKHLTINTLRPRQDGRHFPDDIFKCIFLNENVLISIKISLKFVPKGPINNIPSLIQIMAWCQSGDKPMSEPMMV